MKHTGLKGGGVRGLGVYMCNCRKCFNLGYLMLLVVAEMLLHVEIYLASNLGEGKLKLGVWGGGGGGGYTAGDVFMWKIVDSELLFC